MSEILLVGGLAVAGIAVIVGLAFTIVMWISKHRLNAKLDAEYGKKK